MKRASIIFLTLIFSFSVIAASYAEENTEYIAAEQFYSQLAEILREKHQGDFENTTEPKAYLKSLGVLENVPYSAYGGSPVSCAEAVTLAMNAISVDKTSILKAGNGVYPENYIAAYRFLTGMRFVLLQNQNPAEIYVTSADAQILLEDVRHFAVDRLWTVPREALEQDGIFLSADTAQNMTRGEMAIGIAKALEKKEGFSYAEPDFWDVDKNSDAAQAIGGLQKIGVFNGYEDGSFRPEQEAERAEFWKTCILAAGLDTGTGEYPDYYAGMMRYWQLFGGLGNENEICRDLEGPVCFGEGMQVLYNIWYDQGNTMLNQRNKE